MNIETSKLKRENNKWMDVDVLAGWHLCYSLSTKPSRGVIKLFMLNSTDHEISHAHKNGNAEK